MDCSLPGSSVHGISHVRIQECVAISFSRGSSQPRDRNHISCISHIGRWILYHWATREALPYVSVQFSSVQSLSRVRLFGTPWIIARQASLSITNSWSSLRLTSIESVMPSSHLILCRPLLFWIDIIQKVTQESIEFWNILWKSANELYGQANKFQNTLLLFSP